MPKTASVPNPAKKRPIDAMRMPWEAKRMMVPKVPTPQEMSTTFLLP